LVEGEVSVEECVARMARDADRLIEEVQEEREEGVS